MTDQNHIERIAWYGSLVCQHPRAHVDLTEQTKRWGEQERARMQEECMLESIGYHSVSGDSDQYVYRFNGRPTYRPDWFMILAPTMIPLGVFVLYFSLLFLKIWLTSKGI